MKKYLFNMEKNGHNIELAYNVARNNENWDEFYRIQEVYDILLSNRVDGRFSEVPYDIWKKATEISTGAIEYRARANAGR